MELNPCISLSFDGRCEAAFKFYEKCLGGKIVFTLTWGDSPMADSPMAKDAPPEWPQKILHASFKLGDILMTGCDVPPQQYEKPKGIFLLLGLDDPVDAERIFNALAENGIVRVALQETFWARRSRGRESLALVHVHYSNMPVTR